MDQEHGVGIDYLWQYDRVGKWLVDDVMQQQAYATSFVNEELQAVSEFICFCDA